MIGKGFDAWLNNVSSVYIFKARHSILVMKTFHRAWIFCIFVYKYKAFDKT